MAARVLVGAPGPAQIAVRASYARPIDAVNGGQLAPSSAGESVGGRHLFGRDAPLAEALTALRSDRVVAVVGEPGVGKSALLGAVAQVCIADGVDTVRINGASALSGLAFGALVGLVDTPPQVDTVAVDVARRQMERRCPPGALMVVDDGHEVDEFSARVIGQLVSLGRRLLVACRSGSALPQGLEQCCRHGARFVYPVRLDESSTRAMAESCLGRPCDARTARRVWQATAGLPLAIERLCGFALARGLVEVVNGRARWVDARMGGSQMGGPHMGGPHMGGSARGSFDDLDSILGLGLSALDGRSRRVVELLALARQLPTDVLNVAAPGVDLADLEGKRLVSVAPENGWLRCAHPLLRDAVAAEVGELSRRMLCEELVFAVDKVLAGQGDTTVEGGALRLIRTLFAVDAGLEVDGDELAAFARSARAVGATRGSLRVMARLWEQLPSADSALAYASLLGTLGEWESADAVLAAAADLSGAMDEDELLAISLEHSRCLQLGLASPDRAANVLRRAAGALRGPTQRAELAAHLAELDLLRGRVAAVAEVWERSVAELGDFRRTGGAEALYRLTQSAAPALLFMGQTERARGVLGLSRELRYLHGPTAPLVEVVLEPWWASASILAGCGASEAAAAREAHAAAVASEDSFMEPIWALPLAIYAWLDGDLLRSEALAGDAMGVGAAGVEVRQIARYLLTRVLVLRGCLAAAASVCDAAEHESAETFAEINQSWMHGAIALLRWHRGHAADAVDVARNAAERTAELGQRVPAAFLWSDVAEMGAPVESLSAFRSLAEGSDAPVVGLLFERTEAVVAGDVDALLVNAAQAERGGLRILGLSALHSALELCARADRRSDAPVLTVLKALAELRSRCRGLADDRSVAHAAMSPREVEVAALAASGSSDREIAELLIVSVRTVHAHLRSVYSKLGIGGRLDLAELAWLFSNPARGSEPGG